MTKPKKYEFVRGPVDGAVRPVPKGVGTVVLHTGQAVHFYEARVSFLRSKPKTVFLHVHSMRGE